MSFRHSWGDPVRPDLNNTFRTCGKCGLVKITRHEDDNDPRHWIEWESADGHTIKSDKTPPCEEVMKADAPKTYRLVELRAENYMKLKAVHIAIDGSMLKVNGRNEQGKSALLGAVSAAIVGPKAFPAEPIRKGQTKAEIFLDFGGLKLTRRIWNKEGGGVGQDLVLEYADGKRPKEKQTVLDALRGSPIADDPIAFARLKPKERYDLLKTLVPGYDFEDEAEKRQELFDDRTLVGRDRDRALAAYESIHIVPTVTKPVDVTELAAQMRAAGDHNAKVDQRAENRAQTAERIDSLRDEADKLMARAKTLNAEAAELETKLQAAPELPAKISIEALEAEIASAAASNAEFDKGMQKAQHKSEADRLAAAYDDLTKQIKAKDDEKTAAIAKAKLPIKDLTFGDGDILLDGLPFDQASTARKIRVSTALLMALKPELRVLLVREGSLLDDDARAALEADAKANDFVVLMECVGAGDGSGIVIEDGEVV